MIIKLILFLVINLAVYNSADDNPDNRIINGFTPGRSDVPYVVLLNITLPERTTICTGILLSLSWVLTAGHCGQRAQSIEVQLGMFSRNEGPIQRITVRQNNIFVNPNFVINDTDLINDLALLRMVPPANLIINTVRPIPFVCSVSGNFVNQNGLVCGWGITSDTATNITTVIQCVNMPIITNTECQQAGDTIIRPTHICTRQVNQRTGCRGDSGGPLTVLNGLLQRRKLVGVVSFGGTPCAGTTPNVFTRITTFSNWITQTTGILCDLL